MNHEFKVGGQFDLVESLGIAYSHDQSIAPKGKQFILLCDGTVGRSPIRLGNCTISKLPFWIGDPFNDQQTEVKPIGRFTITSLKNQHN